MPDSAVFSPSFRAERGRSVNLPNGKFSGEGESITRGRTDTVGLLCNTKRNPTCNQSEDGNSIFRFWFGYKGYVGVDMGVWAD